MARQGVRWLTGEEWSSSDNYWLMLHNVIEKFGEEGRKSQLLGSGLCREYWLTLLPESRQLVDEFEEVVDREGNESDFRGLCERANELVTRVSPGQDLVLAAAKATCYAVLGDPWGPIGHFMDCDATATSKYATIIRDIFGNPFRPVTFAPEWRTEAAVGIAAKMYESRDFGNMPILADALQDAGCDHADILAHCRGDGPHVRGCWVVDLVLGKT